jgi:hypothetical protein
MEKAEEGDRAGCARGDVRPAHHRPRVRLEQAARRWCVALLLLRYYDQCVFSDVFSCVKDVFISTELWKAVLLPLLPGLSSSIGNVARTSTEIQVQYMTITQSFVLHYHVCLSNDMVVRLGVMCLLISYCYYLFCTSV